MIQPPLIAIIVVLVGSGVAIVTDLRRFKVYNALTLPMLVSGLGFHGIVGGWVGLGESFCGMLFGFGILFVPYLLGAMGAGDVKLLAAIGAWLGVVLTMYVLFISLLATAVYSFVMLGFQGRIRDLWTNLQVAFFRLQTIGRHLVAIDEHETVQAMLARPVGRSRLIPFSVMVGIGAVATLTWYLVYG